MTPATSLLSVLAVIGITTADDYLTPQLATGLTFKLDEHNSISTKVQYNWKDWNPDTVGFALGYQYGF